MNKRFLLAGALALLLAPAFLRAETINVQETAKVTPAVKSDTSAKVTPTASTVVQDSVNSAKIEKLKAEIADLKTRNDELLLSIEELKTQLKGIEESSLEMKNISGDLDAYKGKLDEFEAKYGKDKAKIDKSLSEFESLKDDFKQKVDKLAGWNDILDVLKKELNNNELEMARLKKSISEIKGQYSQDDNVLNSIAKWPYLSLTALLVAVAAFVAAVVR